MSVNLPTHYVQQYATTVELLLQQRGSKLSDTVTMGSYVGKQGSPVDQIGSVNPNKVTGRFQAMPRVDASTDRRWVFPVDYDLPQLIDKFDKLRLLTDPSSAYVTNAMYAMGRAKDDEIIAAFDGDAKTGESGATTTSFPSGQSVSVDEGGTASNLNVAKLRAAKKILMANEVDIEADMLCCVITASQHDALLNEVQIISKDYNDKPVLVSGMIQSFLGINMKHCERLLTGTDDQSGTSRRVPVYAKSGMHMGQWNDITTDIDQRKDLQGLPWQAYVYGTFGATRLEEEKVVRIWSRES